MSNQTNSTLWVKIAQIKIPECADEEYLVGVVKKSIDLEAQRREIVENILKKFGLTKKDLKDFGKFRENS